MAYDINKILAEYGDNDFGFSAVSEEEYNAVIAEKDETVEEYKTRLVQIEDGFKVTNPEGFVAVDKLSGNAVKLVDRLEFSHLNFTAQKNWSK